MILEYSNETPTSDQAERAYLLQRARRAFLKRALKYGTATVDDAREAVELPRGVSPNLFASVPGPLAEKGIIQRCGYRPSYRPEAHERQIGVWKLRDRDAAERWLRDNPIMPPEERAKLPVQLSLFGASSISPGGRS